MHFRSATAVALITVAIVLAGCDESATDPVAQLMRANAQLQEQVAAQARLLFIMGGALIVMGAGLAVALGALWWKKGGRPLATTQTTEAS